MKKSVKRVSKQALSIVLTIMLVMSTMLIGVVTANAVSLSDFTVYFVKPSTWTKTPHLAVGHSDWGSIYAPDANIDSKLYKFTVSTWDDADGYYFTDSQSTDSGSKGDYYRWHISKATSGVSHSTTKITSGTKNLVYSVGSTVEPDGGISVTSEALTNCTVSASVYVKSGSNFTPASSSIATASVSGYYFNSSGTRSSSTSQVAKYTSAKFTTSSSNSSYKFLGWYTSSNSQISGATSTTYTVSSVESSTTLHAVYELSNYTVSAVAKYQNYDPDTGEYENTLHTDSNGTYGSAVANPTSVAPNGSSTLTATVKNSKYEFAGWYSDSGCTDSHKLTDLTEFHATNVSSNSTYYALFREIPPTKYAFTLDTSQASGVNVTVKYNNQTVTSGTLIPAGGTVTVTVNGIPSTKKCSVTVNGGAVTVSGSNGNYTFKMPDSAASIAVTLEDKKTYTVTAKSNYDSYGKATVSLMGSSGSSSSSITVEEGQMVTVTATANAGYQFKEWQMDGIEISNRTSKTMNIQVNANITATAVFEEETGTLQSNMYLLYGTSNNYSGWNNSLRVYKLSDGKYVARFTGVKLAKSTNYYFALSSSTSTSGLYWQSNSNVPVFNSYTDYINAFTQEYSGYHFGGFSIKSDDVTDVTIVVGVDDGNGHIKEPHYEVIPTIAAAPEGTATVYAKNGTIGDNDKTSSAYGTTVVKAVDKNSYFELKTEHTDYDVYYVEQGSMINVTTTVKDTTRYVHAFVVNGKGTYLATAGTKNTYSAEIPIDDSADVYEITPIYYLNECKTPGQYITFYVDVNDAVADANWGDTIACYTYYYINPEDTSTDSYHADGDYPGQPLLYNAALDRYYARVPKTMNGKAASGVTINNYYNDPVHKDLTKETLHKQSLDFDAFKHIYNLGAEVMLFQLHPRAGSRNNIDIQKSGSFNLTTYKNNNGWDDYTDLQGNNVDPLGEPADPSNTKKAYIVSVGPTERNTAVGQWPSYRYVYGEDGTLITQGYPSDFIPRPAGTEQTQPYKDIHDKGYAGAVTQITYETAREVDGAHRTDGRWYYQLNTSVTADVKVQLSPDGSDWSAPAQFNASAATINGQTSVTFDSIGESASVVAKSMKGYVFAGWGTVDKDGDNYQALPTSLGTSFETTVDTEIHYIARFIKASSGTLVLTHSKYLGDGAKGGIGYYYISAVVKHQDGTSEPVKSGTGTGASGQSITLNISQTDTIQVTLRTVTSGENTFRYWYVEGDNGFEIIDDPDGNMTHNGTATTDPFGENGTLTYTFETEAWKLFSGSEQVVSEFNYYSDISPVSKDYVLTYKYIDRFGKQKSYIVRGEHNDEYYDTNGSWAPTQELIYANAPAIDDLYKDCKWVVTESSIDGASATLEAVQTEKTYHVEIFDTEGISDEYDLPLDSYVLNDSDNYYVAPETYDNKKFAYWEVKENNKEVARHFSRYFTLRVAGDYVIKPVYGDDVKDNLYISEAQYSREQYTDSTGDHDYVYADFILAFMSSNGTILNENTDYQTGILVEVDRNTVLSNGDIVNGKANYSDKSFNSSESDLKRIAQGTDSKTTYIYSSSNERTVFNFKANNSNYNNMNRLDYFIKFSNTENNRKLVLKAYYYVIKDGEVTLSAPVYFNFYNIGTQSANTGE